MARRAEEIQEYPESDRAEACPHPRETYDLIGHEAAEKRFIQARQSCRLHHAWLITGGPGIGKATLAYRMIRSILGGQSLLETALDIPASDPVSQRIESLGHGDFFLLRRPYDLKLKKLRSEIPVGETRKLAEFFSKRPAEGGWRVCLIDAMDDMNRNSENAILKTLEEPPDRAILILISNNPGRLLPTIRSRCMTLALREVPQEDIATWLRGLYPAENPDVIRDAVGLSRGAPGRAQALVQNASSVLTPLSRFLSGLSDAGSLSDQKIANDLALTGRDRVRALFWEGLQDLLHAEALHSYHGEWTSAFRPSGARKSPDTWNDLWRKALHLQERESALNMDKKTVLFDALSAIRAA